MNRTVSRGFRLECWRSLLRFNYFHYTGSSQPLQEKTGILQNRAKQRCRRQNRAPSGAGPAPPGLPPCGRGAVLGLSSRASSASRGISNFRPLPLEMVKPCPGADHTKEFLSFEKQPSLFKGRNQSWFHPLRTPSRPGAAAPGPHGGQRAVGGAFACHLPAAMHQPPAARFWDTLLSSYDFLRTTQGCALVVTPESRRLPLTVIPSEWNESRDLQPGTAATLEGRVLPWRRPHEGIPVLWETTFAFQRAKPIVVSPFENPFPTRGRGPWTPTEGSGQSLVSSHTIYRPRPTDRQLLGFTIRLSSYYFLRTTQGPFHQGVPAPDPVPALT